MRPFFVLGAAAVLACASAGAGGTTVDASLRNIAAAQISSIHFIRGTDAVTTYGMQYGAGVIDIRTK